MKTGENIFLKKLLAPVQMAKNFIQKNIFNKTNLTATLLVFGSPDKHNRLYTLDAVEFPQSVPVYFGLDDYTIKKKREASIIGYASFKIIKNTLIGEMEIDRNFDKAPMALELINYGAQFKTIGVREEEKNENGTITVKDYQITGVALFIEIK